MAGKLKRVDDTKFVLRYSPRKAKSVWSKLNRERVEKMMKGGKMTTSGLAVVEESKKNGSWINVHTSQKPFKIPPDFKRALAVDRKHGVISRISPTGTETCTFTG